MAGEALAKQGWLRRISRDTTAFKPLGASLVKNTGEHQKAFSYARSLSTI